VFERELGLVEAVERHARGLQGDPVGRDDGQCRVAGGQCLIELGVAVGQQLPGGAIQGAAARADDQVCRELPGPAGHQPFLPDDIGGHLLLAVARGAMARRVGDDRPDVL
jgi:hypothetical protein